MVKSLIKFAVGLFCDLMSFMTGTLSEVTMIDFSGKYAKLWAITTQAADDLFIPIGSLFVVIYFFITISDKVSFEQLTFEQVMKELIRLVAGLYLVINTSTVITGCISIGNGLLTEVQSIIQDASLDSTFTDLAASQSAIENNFLTAIKDLNSGVSIIPLVGLLFVAFFLIFLIFLLLAFVIIKIICIARMIEICAKTALAPLALSDTFNGNIMQSHAVAFIRSFLALCLQGVFIALALNLFPLFINGLLTDFVNTQNPFALILNIVEMIAFAFAILIFILKSGSVSKEIMGAR